MRDSARFHFGFTVPFISHIGASGVVAAIAASRGDIGLVPAATATGPWWAALEGDDAPKIIARLPFVERADHPAGLPVFGIARPNPDALVTDVECWSIRVSGWSHTVSRALHAEVLALQDGAFDGAALLISVPQGGIETVTAALVSAGASVRSKALVGSHATRYTVTADGPVSAGR
jgi:hypothetical protein